MNTAAHKTIDEYISSQAEEKRKLLQKLRETILEAAPGAAESISYAMPAFKLNGKPLVYFALQRNHIGFYATPSANIAFTAELKEFMSSKGAVQFPLDKPVPYDLIGKMVKFKKKEILSGTAGR